MSPDRPAREHQTCDVGDPVEQAPREGDAGVAARELDGPQLFECLQQPRHPVIGRLAAYLVDPAEYAFACRLQRLRMAGEVLQHDSHRDESDRGEDHRERAGLGAREQCATEAEHCESHTREQSGHDDLPRRDDGSGTPLSGLAVGKGRREHLTARQRLADRVRGEHHRQRLPLGHTDTRRAQQRSLYLREAVHREQCGDDARDEPHPIEITDSVRGLFEFRPDQHDLDRQDDHHDRHQHPPNPPEA